MDKNWFEKILKWEDRTNYLSYQAIETMNQKTIKKQASKQKGVLSCSALQ